MAVAVAKAYSDGASIEPADALFEVSGTRSSLEHLDLHRHWRDARTHTPHDPVPWKIQHSGRYTLTSSADCGEARPSSTKAGTCMWKARAWPGSPTQCRRGTALVGSHGEVADRIAEYHDLGISEFVLSGYPHLEEAYWFGEGVLPLLEERGLWAHPTRPTSRRPALVPFAAS